MQLIFYRGATAHFAQFQIAGGEVRLSNTHLYPREALLSDEGPKFVLVWLASYSSLHTSYALAGLWGSGWAGCPGLGTYVDDTETAHAKK